MSGQIPFNIEAEGFLVHLVVHEKHIVSAKATYPSRRIHTGGTQVSATEPRATACKKMAWGLSHAND